MSEYATIILEILIAVVMTMIMKYVVPYIKTLTENEKYNTIVDMVTIAVKAAEQTINEKGQGKIKKAQVLADVSHWLTENGIHITEVELDRIIEHAVWCMKNEKV